jgi:cytochrome c biogenesis protein CcmG/thiol:disulfide interchange protein DsbE
MKIKVIPFIIILIFIVTFIIFFKGLKNLNIYTPNVSIEKNIPDFNALVFENDIRVNSKKVFEDNHFFLFNIWASWCLPCRDEHAYLMSLSKEENLKIIGLNYKDKKDNAKNFLNELNNPYDLILTDEDGTIAIEWGAFGVPETFLIYKNRIVKKIIGPLNNKSLLEIEKLIK